MLKQAQTLEEEEQQGVAAAVDAGCSGMCSVAASRPGGADGRWHGRQSDTAAIRPSRRADKYIMTPEN